MITTLSTPSRIIGTPAETTELLEFAERTFRMAWQAMNDEMDFELYCKQAFTHEKFREEMSAANAEFYSIEKQGKMLAYLKLNLDTYPQDWTSGPALQIERIYVDQNIQSAGIGKQLLQFSEQRALETGLEWVWLSVWKVAPRSIAFYEKNGYTIFGEDVFMIGTDPQMDWLMRKRADKNP